MHSPSQEVSRVAFVKSCSNILSCDLKRGAVEGRDGGSSPSLGYQKKLKEGEGVEINPIDGAR